MDRSAGRCPHPASDAIDPAPLPGTPRHLPIAQRRRRQACQEKFKSYPIDYFHIDIAEVSTEQGKLRLFVGIDRTSKFAFVRLVESAGKMEAVQFLRELIEVVPYRIHTMLTDNSVQFTNRKQDVWAFQHIFNRVCNEHDIEHRLTKVNHPRTTDEIEQPLFAEVCYFPSAHGRPGGKERGWR